MTRPVILTVDDDAQVLSAIAGDLRRRFGKDYRIIRASDATEALVALRQLKKAAEPVALRLSDQRMPGLDGVGFLAEARELFPNARRALLTAYADTDAAIAAINRSQVDYYLQKPWDPPEQHLYPVVEELFDDWRSQYRPGYGGVKVIGSRFAPSVHQVKEFLTRNHVPYEFFDVEATDERGDEARTLAGGRTPARHCSRRGTPPGALRGRPRPEGRSERRGQGHGVRRGHRGRGVQRDSRRPSTRPPKGCPRFCSTARGLEAR
jgi:CheY-like chemotaxis protein